MSPFSRCGACAPVSAPETACAPRLGKGSAAAALFSPVLRRAPHCWQPAPRRAPVRVQSFALSKALGLSKPRWLALPDFGLEKRRAVLDRFFGPIDRQASRTNQGLLPDVRQSACLRPPGLPWPRS